VFDCAELFDCFDQSRCVTEIANKLTSRFAHPTRARFVRTSCAASWPASSYQPNAPTLRQMHPPRSAGMMEPAARERGWVPLPCQGDGRSSTAIAQTPRRPLLAFESLFVLVEG
jgi:hypothetical protein